MDPTAPIDADVPCGKCGYNLRTLAITARCPECGFPALRSFIHAEVRQQHPATRQQAIPWKGTQLVARLLGRNVDAILFVRAALQHAEIQHLMPVVGRRPSITARELCDAIRAHALAHYGSVDHAAATLRFWGIQRSEDVGQIVAGLIEAGLAKPHPHESPAAFNGIFTLDTLFE